MNWERKVVRTIALLVVTILGANALVFLVYRHAFPAGSLGTQVWGYLDSKVFSVVTVSILLPFLLFLVQHLFKIKEAIEEGIRKQKQARRDARWECIKRTAAMWNQMDTITTKVRYYENEPHQKESIEQILQELRNFSTAAEDVVNDWSHSFPDVPLDDLECSLDLINAQLNAAHAVAYFIERGAKEDEARELQASLDIIQAGIKTVLHHRLVNVLKHSAKLEESDLDPAKAEEHRKKLADDLKAIKNWSGTFKEWARDQPYLPTLKGKATASFEESARKLEAWSRENRGKMVGEAPVFTEVETALTNLPFNELVSGSVVSYSKEYVRVLARKMAHESVYWAIQDRAR